MTSPRLRRYSLSVYLLSSESGFLSIVHEILTGLDSCLYPSSLREGNPGGFDFRFALHIGQLCDLDTVCTKQGVQNLCPHVVVHTASPSLS